jgi:hypothetical protein
MIMMMMMMMIMKIEIESMLIKIYSKTEAGVTILLRYHALVNKSK